MSSSNSLPPGWCEAKLPDVAQVNPTLPEIRPNDETTVSFIPMASVEALTGHMDTSDVRLWRDVKKGYTRFQEGDLLFAKITPCMENGKAAIARGLASGAGAGSTEFHVLRPGPALQPEFLLQYVLQEEFRKAARSEMTGTAGQLRVPSRFLDRQTIPLPAVPEQRRIASAIESYFTRLDDAVASLERAQRNLKRYRASVLKAAVEGRLVPTEAETARAEGRSYELASVLLERILAERRRLWEEAELAKMKTKGKAPKDDRWKAKYVEPVAPDTSELPELPEGWCWATLALLLREPLRNGHSAKQDAAGALRTLSLSAVTERDFSERNTKLTAANPNAVRDLWLQPGDIFVERSNTPELVGTAAIYSGPSSFAIFPDLLIRVRASEEIPAPYLEAVLRSDRVRTYLQRSAQGIAGSMPKISQETLERLIVPLPPTSEQARIVAEVDRQLSLAVDIGVASAASGIRTQRLRQSILKWAFEGRLVDQDPTDEPASCLLEHIRAERESATEKQPPRLRRPRARKKDRT